MNNPPTAKAGRQETKMNTPSEALATLIAILQANGFSDTFIAEQVRRATEQSE